MKMIILDTNCRSDLPILAFMAIYLVNSKLRPDPLNLWIVFFRYKKIDPEMTFNNLHQDTPCNCIEDAKEDFESHYGLKTNKNAIRLVDFDSYWEKGRRPQSKSCGEVCSFKGKSVTLITNENLSEVTEIFKQLFPLSPGYKPFLTIVKLADNTGRVKHTPDSRNKYHHDFYKCDNFTLENITQLQSIPLADV